jgi:hypothetical protein
MPRCRVAIPPKSSGIYGCSTPVPKADWAKALAWAVTMQLVQHEQRGSKRQQQQHTAGVADTAGKSLVLPPQLAAPPTEQQRREGEAEGHGSGSEARSSSGEEREESPSSSAKGAAECPASPVAVDDGPAAASAGGSSGLNGRLVEDALPLHPAAVHGSTDSRDSTPGDGQKLFPGGGKEQAGRPGDLLPSSSSSQAGITEAAAGALRWALQLLLPATLLPLLASLAAQLQSRAPMVVQPLVAPLAGGVGRMAAWLGGSELLASHAAGGVEAQLGEQHATRQPLTLALDSSSSGSSTSAALAAAAAAGATAASAAASGGDGEESGSVRSNGGGGPLGEEVQLGPRAIQYGLAMVRRSGGGIKQGVRGDNSYEKKLLAEVRLGPRMPGVPSLECA